MTPRYLPILTLIFTLASLGAAAALSALGVAEARDAWAAFGAGAVFFTGLHVPAPGQQGPPPRQGP